LLSFLWAKDASTVVYIQNRSPYAILGNETPEEAFIGEKQDVGHLRIFGCPVYIHVPNDKRTKMEPSGKKGIFVGYNETSKTYKIYVPGERHIEVSKDVSFHEEATFKRSEEIQLDTEMEELEASHVQVSESFNSDMQREELDEPLDVDDPVEPVEQVERPLDVPQSKRKPAWCREIMQEANSHGASLGTFRESKRSQRFVGYVTQVSQISKCRTHHI
jgi:hypothetical protein